QHLNASLFCESVTCGCCHWRFNAFFPGWTQGDSYWKKRSSRTERGVRAYSPAWSELPSRI
ncbi:hypothetical protein BME73_13920, partial [Klebsiella pneumoniae]